MMNSRKILLVELNSFVKLIFCSGNTAGTYKLEKIFLEYHTIFDKHYTVAIDKLYTGTAVVSNIKVTSIY